MNKEDRKVLNMMTEWIEGAKSEYNEAFEDAMWDAIQKSQIPARRWVKKSMWDQTDGS